MLGLTPERFVPRDHPLWRIKPLVDSALGRMSPLFDEVYAAGGRPSIPPEHLLKASLLLAFYTIRSERQFCEQLRYNILLKWFLDRNVEDEPFHPTTFTKNRERLLEADPCSSQGQAAARVLLKEVVHEARRRRLLSADHFTVDGTLLEAWPLPRAIDRATSTGRAAAGATAMRTSEASAAAVTRTSRPLIPRCGSSAKANNRRRGSAIWAMSSPRTGTAWSSTSS